MELELKTCPVCKQDKTLSEYYVRKSRARADGAPSYQHGCKSCRKEATRDWQAAHPERTRQLARRSSLSYYARNKATIMARNKAEQAANPEAARAKWRARYAKRKAKLAAAALQEAA